MIKRTFSGVIALETEWDANFNSKLSVRNMLEFLGDAQGIPFIHRHVASESDLQYYLERAKNYTSYSILYLGFHGGASKLEVPKEGEFNLYRLVDLGLEKMDNKIIHFSGCGISKYINSKKFSIFLAHTGASAISGYRGKVNWMESALLEQALIFQASIETNI